MILVTVGMQMPFDRLVRAVDDWAGARGRTDVVAQIGRTDWRPTHMRSTPFLTSAEFRRHLRDAEAIVTHAGMGSILAALETETPILVMPRRGALRETRNDHQLATARVFESRGSVGVAWDETLLPGHLDRLALLPVPGRAAPHASAALLDTVRAFVRNEPLPAATAGRIRPGHDAPTPERRQAA